MFIFLKFDENKFERREKSIITPYKTIHDDNRDFFSSFHFLLIGDYVCLLSFV